MINYLAFVLTGTFWGGSFVAIKYAIADSPPLLAALLRVLVGIVFLTILYSATSKSFSVPRNVRFKVWLTGFFAQGLPFAFLFWGEQSVSPGFAGIMNGTVPLWTFVLSLFFARQLEAISPRVMAGIGLGFVGLIVIYFPLLRCGGGPGQILGALALLGMAVSYSIATIMNRYILVGENKVDLYASVYQQHLASATFLILITGLTGSLPAIASLTRPAVLAILYLGICSTAIAWLMFYKLIREWGAIRASAITYIVPPVAILLDFLVFSNPPTLFEAAGVALVLGGVFLVQRPPVKS